MPSIKRVESQISQLEGFDVTFRHGRDNGDIRSDLGSVTGYAAKYDRAARNAFTVADWKRARFEPHYPGFEVDVLRANGKPAAGRMTLAKIRAEYE